MLNFRYDEWQTTFAAWKEENPDKAKMLQDGIDDNIPSVDELMAAIPEFDQDTDIATRIAGQMVLQVCGRPSPCSACVCEPLLVLARSVVHKCCSCINKQVERSQCFRFECPTQDMRRGW